MSAIFGILRFDGAEANPRELERMGNTLAHRGPDGRKFIVDGPVGLGHCLLRVNNEDLFEAQPLSDRKAGLMLVADARIDNREELAATFGWSPEECRDRPDSQFILEAYKIWGEEAAEHLLGDFVFAIWDGRAQKLVLARDHMGQRGLLYHRGELFLAFASAERALWAVADVPRALSERHWISALVQDQNREPGSTIFEGIRGLTGGTTMAVDASANVTSRRYWEPHADPAHMGRDLDYYVAAYRRVLEEAVACRLRRTAHPAGLLFSGGFDSTAIAGLAGPIMQAQKRKLLAFCSAMPEGHEHAQNNGTPRIDWCRRDMPHLDIRVLPPDLSVLTQGLDSTFANIELPVALSVLLSCVVLGHAARAGARFVMDGHGGDSTLNPTGGGALTYFLKTGQLRRFVTEMTAWRQRRHRSIARTLLVDVVLRMTWASLEGGLRALRYGIPLFRPRLPVAKQVMQEARTRGLRWARGTDLAVRIPKAERFSTKLGARQYNARLVIIPSDCALDYSRPFHDKRVVELGLAIPEDFDVIDGRARATGPPRPFRHLPSRVRRCGEGAGQHNTRACTHGTSDAARPRRRVRANGMQSALVSRFRFSGDTAANQSCREV